MGVNLQSLIQKMYFMVRVSRLIYKTENKVEDLTDRETMMLELINMKPKMSISEISSLYSSVSSSTISNTITKLWRTDKLVSKTINHANQRITNVSLTK